MNNFTIVPNYRRHSDRVRKLSEEQEARSVGSEGGIHECMCVCACTINFPSVGHWNLYKTPQNYTVSLHI